MRPIILILIVAILALLAGIGTGFIDINQIRGAKAPDIDATSNGVVARGGHAPAFDVETGSVQVGAREQTVKVPEVKVVPPPESNQAATNGQ